MSCDLNTEKQEDNFTKLDEVSPTRPSFFQITRISELSRNAAWTYLLRLRRARLLQKYLPPRRLCDNASSRILLPSSRHPRRGVTDSFPCRNSEINHPRSLNTIHKIVHRKGLCKPRIFPSPVMQNNEQDPHIFRYTHTHTRCN